MISLNYVNPVLWEKTKCFYDEKTCYYDEKIYSRAETIKHPHMHQVYLSLSKIKKNVKTFLFERRDHQEKKPQDGKTNPME